MRASKTNPEGMQGFIGLFCFFKTGFKRDRVSLSWESNPASFTVMHRTSRSLLLRSITVRIQAAANTKHIQSVPALSRSY